MNRKVLVTGANGFVGSRLCGVLAEQGWEVLAGVRSGGGLFRFDSPAIKLVEIGNLEDDTNRAQLLTGCQALVHLAGRVHVMRDSVVDPLGQYLAANTEATRRLAEAAAQAGVGRFVLVSTIKVSGEQSPVPGVAEDGSVIWAEDMPTAPEGPYAVSKARAEEELRSVCRRTGMEYVIVRPPLIYGPGGRANFLSLLKLVDRGLPLPLASLDNRRSLLGLGNLVDFISCCLEHPAAAGQIFQVSDREPFSTPGLIRALASALGRPARLFPFPIVLLEACIIGRGPRAVWKRLAGSLTVDGGKAETLLGWRPPIESAVELAATATWYRQQAVRAER